MGLHHSVGSHIAIRSVGESEWLIPGLQQGVGNNGQCGDDPSLFQREECRADGNG